MLALVLDEDSSHESPAGNGFTVLLVVLSGGLDFLVQGLGYWWLAPVIFIPLMKAIERGGLLRSLIAATGAGLVFWILGLYWLPAALQRYVDGYVELITAFAIAVVVQTIPFLLGGATAFLFRNAGVPVGIGLALGIPFGELVCAEFIPFSHALPLLGCSLGGTLLSVLGREVGAAVVISTGELIRQVGCGLVERKIQKTILGLCLGALIIGLLTFVERSSQRRVSASSELRIGLVQGKTRPGEGSGEESEFLWHAERSRASFSTGSIDLLVWGEAVSSVPATSVIHRGQFAGLELPPVLFGALVLEPGCLGCGYFNSVLLSGACGSSFRYDKRRLVPIAETSFWRDVQSLRTEYRQGDSEALLHLDDAVVYTPICYEGMFEGELAEAVRRGARMVINVVRDQALGSPIASLGMDSLTRLGAREYGLPLIRLVDGGPTTVRDSRGEVLLNLQAQRRNHAVVEVALPAEASPYSRNRRAILTTFSLLMAVGMLVGLQGLFQHWRHGRIGHVRAASASKS